MKAQVSFVEFITAIIIFLTTATYISFQISTFIPTYLNEIRAERMRAEAYQLSELLINDPGEPINWYQQNFDNVKRLGLSDEMRNKTNFLSLKKITAFNGNCSINYTKVKEKLGLDYDFSLLMQGKINCVPSQTITRFSNITIRRIVAYEDNGVINYGEIVLHVW